MTNTDYTLFLSDLKSKIKHSQYEAMKAVNTHLIQLYWEIGKSITEKQAQQGWGKSVVENLSKDLQAEFADMRGLSARNLWLMADFYAEYHSVAFLQSMIAEISWTHHTLILSKCKDNQQRRFYILATKKFGWTARVLTHQIENQTFEKYLLNQTNFEEVLPEMQKQQAVLAVKDHYNFDFLELADQHSEFELETALIKNIQKFLLELGSDFSFMGHQFRLIVDGEDYKIDLLFYHRRLQALIAIDLKIGRFKPEYKGQMEFYLNVLNDTVRLAHEKESIGVIVCREKSRTVVEYSLKNTNHPIGVATYSLTSTLPENLKQFLPDAQKIAEKVDTFFTTTSPAPKTHLDTPVEK
jgi:predicted nuclease of restriction endonuclease-like (RecB) superfamily